MANSSYLQSKRAHSRRIGGRLRYPVFVDTMKCWRTIRLSTHPGGPLAGARTQNKSGVYQKRPFLTHLTEVSRPASSGSAAVSDCISKPMSHKVVGFLGFETHAQMKLIFPVTSGRRGHSGQHCCKPYVGLATFTVNTYHTF